MGLTDDQKAMLRLLAQREEGYEDMAALMGISVEEVRERVKEALSEVDEGAEDPTPTEPAADTAPAAEATQTPTTPEPPSPAAEIKPPPSDARDATTASAATPAEPAAASPAAATPRAKRVAPLSRLKVPKDRGALIGLGAGALAVLAFVIVLVVSGAGDSGSSASDNGGGLAEGTPSAAENAKLTQAVLSPVDGGEGDGRALFGRFQKKVLLQVTAEGLEPTQQGESYAIWLSHGGRAMVPVGTAKTNESGELAARFEVPTAVLVLVARGVFDQIDVTRTVDSRLSAAIAAARRTKAESTYTGAPVLSGKITGPLLQAGERSGG